MQLSREHINYTLGIIVPLNEAVSFSKRVETLVLEEQMLYESFLDGIKGFAQDKVNKIVNTIRDWKDFAAHLAQVLSNSDWLESLLDPLHRRVLSALTPVTNILKKLGLDNIVNNIKSFVQKIKALRGWKAFMGLISLGSIMTFIVEKVKDFAPEEIKAFIVKQFSGDFVQTITQKLTDWKSYLGWFQPIVQGADIIFKFLQPFLSQAFLSKAKKEKEGGYLDLMREETELKRRFQYLAGLK